jgi:hypothetical protein
VFEGLSITIKYFLGYANVKDAASKVVSLHDGNDPFVKKLEVTE